MADSENCMGSVLIVDDEADILLIVRGILEDIEEDAGQKINIDYAMNGKDALKKIEEKPYDLIMTDLRMPQMTGDQFIAEKRKSNGPNKNTTVFVMSAYIEDLKVDPDDEDVFLFTKPVKLDFLEKLIKRFLLVKAA